jgi:hypothetical protein
MRIITGFALALATFAVAGCAYGPPDTSYAYYQPYNAPIYSGTASGPTCGTDCPPMGSVPYSIQDNAQ